MDRERLSRAGAGRAGRGRVDRTGAGSIEASLRLARRAREFGLLPDRPKGEVLCYGAPLVCSGAALCSSEARAGSEALTHSLESPPQEPVQPRREPRKDGQKERHYGERHEGMVKHQPQPRWHQEVAQQAKRDFENGSGL